MADQFHGQIIETLPSLRAYAVALTRDRDRADDLVQDTVVRALSRAELFVEGTSIRAWMFTILRNQYIDSMRRKRRSGLTDVPDELLRNLQSVAANQEHWLILQDLLRSMWRLGPDQREVLSLVVMNGMSYEEAAAVCKCPVGTVRSRLARARRELQRMMLGEEPAKPRPRPQAPTVAAIETNAELA